MSGPHPREGSLLYEHTLVEARKWDEGQQVMAAAERLRLSDRVNVTESETAQKCLPDSEIHLLFTPEVEKDAHCLMKLIHISE